MKPTLCKKKTILVLSVFLLFFLQSFAQQPSVKDLHFLIGTWQTEEHNNADGWKEANDLYAAVTFTWGRYMESLRQYCETGKGEPFQ